MKITNILYKKKKTIFQNKNTIKKKSKGDKNYIRSRNLFLTYSSTSNINSREYILEQLETKCEIKNHVIALEYHLDGEPHFHVVITLSKQPCCGMDFFDIQDPKDKEHMYHPNIQIAELPHDILYTIKKDKEFLLKGFSIEDCKKKMQEIEAKNIMNQSVRVFNEKGYDAALDYFMENATVDQQTKFGSRIKNLIKILNEMKYRLPFPKAKYKLEDFYKVVGVENFINAFSKEDGHGAMFIGGVSGIGKTHYIEALLTNLNLKWITVTSFEQLKQYDLNCLDFIIFDDVEFKKIETSEEFLKLFEHTKHTPIPCRVKDEIIPAGVGRIFLSNSSFYEILEKRGIETNPALIRRVYDCIIIHYLSPKIPRAKKLKAIDKYPQHIINKTINLVNHGNIGVVGNDLEINPRDFLIPEHNSQEYKIKSIDLFAENQNTLEISSENNPK